jgi:predicted CopG family antitoxin
MIMAYVRLNITIPKETLSKLRKIAETEKRSLSNMITYLVEKY